MYMYTYVYDMYFINDIYLLYIHLDWKRNPVIWSICDLSYSLSISDPKKCNDFKAKLEKEIDENKEYPTVKNISTNDVEQLFLAVRI